MLANISMSYRHYCDSVKTNTSESNKRSERTIELSIIRLKSLSAISSLRCFSFSLSKSIRDLAIVSHTYWLSLDSSFAASA